MDDAERLKRRFSGRPGEAATAWADGFATAAQRFRSAWTGKSVDKSDKAMLRLVADAAADAEEAARLDRLLPEWLPRRWRLRT
jgi:hypothetical protein